MTTGVKFISKFPGTPNSERRRRRSLSLRGLNKELDQTQETGALTSEAVGVTDPPQVDSSTSASDGNREETKELGGCLEFLLLMLICCGLEIH